jgi:hypothetical protein
MMVVTPLSSLTNFIISLIQDFYYVYDEYMEKPSIFFETLSLYPYRLLLVMSESKNWVVDIPTTENQNL